jgi:hypothetical protein
MTGSGELQSFLSNAEHNGKPRFDRRNDPSGHLGRGMPVLGAYGTAQALAAAAGGLVSHQLIDHSSRDAIVLQPSGERVAEVMRPMQVDGIQERVT